MRVLILTHPRSGGMSLTSWIARELNLHFNHEPFNTNQDFVDLAFNQDNQVVKDFPNHIENAGVNLYDFINTFDKVIIHTREDNMDTAISLSKMVYNYDHHKIYKVEENWNEEHKDEINAHLIQVNSEKKKLMELTGYLNVTHNGIYETKEDIIRLTEYLGVDKPKWLDILNKRHKLRGGSIGMEDIIGPPINIVNLPNLDK